MVSISENKMPTLTEGALSKMLANAHIDSPILQLMAHKRMAENRLRFAVSDGITNYTQAVVLEEKFNQRVISGQFDPKYSVIRVNRYIVNRLSNATQPVLIIQDLTIIMPGTQVNQKLGPVGNLMGSQMCNTDNMVSNENIAVAEKLAPSSIAQVKNNTEENNYDIDNNRTPTASASITNADAVCPIKALTPYYNAWTIRARVMSKSSLRTYCNARGEGKLFSFDVTDKDDEIRINAFNKECDKFFKLIEVGLIYYISRGSIKTANKKFSNLNNEYEITLNSDSVIVLCTEAVELPKMQFKFTEIKQLENVGVSSCVDVIGVLRNVGDMELLVSKKNNKELKKRDIILVDKTNFEVRLSVWGEVAEYFNGCLGDIIAVKNAIVGKFNGKTLSSGSGTTLQINPDLTEALTIKDWYDKEGSNITAVSLSKSNNGGSNQSFKYLCQANLESVGDTVMYFNAKGIIMTSGKSNQLLYKACGNNGCLKKVREENNGMYHCDKCNKNQATFEYRLILSVCIADCTGDMWVTMFQEHAEKLIGKSSKELSELILNDQNELEAEIAKLLFKSYQFRIGSRVNEFNGERRVKSNCYSALVVDPVDKAKKLLQCIRAWSQ